MIGGAFRRRRSRGGPYRDHPTANVLELWPAISAAAKDRARDLRAAMPSSNSAVPDSALIIPAFLRNQWISLAVLAVSTIFAGAALLVCVTPQRVPRRIYAHELARLPLGDYVAVLCDYVQNSDRGRLRGVTLCGVGPRILAVAGGNRRHDDGRMLQGHIEMIPGGHRPSWASALRRQVDGDTRYYDFYLERDSHGDDTPDGLDDEGDPWVDVDRQDHRGNEHPHDDSTPGAFFRVAAVASSLAILAGWFVWIRLWQLRRRAATWTTTG
ncbi:MAG TPA: hypothetical protein VF469_21025 [Kofleriaceae bacterium]